MAVIQGEITDDQLDPAGLIAQTLALEYAAKAENKAILMRGTKSFSQNTTLNTTLTLLASSLKTTSTATPSQQKTIAPYSISFGTSLFAGSFQDVDASAFRYLAKANETVAGYALLVDKKQYYHDRNNRLFFIPPLSSVAAIFSRGEFFHARTLAAVSSKKKGQYVKIEGIADLEIDDPYGLILITRDPLKQAQLFIEFFNKNKKLITKDDKGTITPEELEKNQEAAALHTKALATISKAVTRKKNRAAPAKAPAHNFSVSNLRNERISLKLIYQNNATRIINALTSHSSTTFFAASTEVIKKIVFGSNKQIQADTSERTTDIAPTDNISLSNLTNKPITLKLLFSNSPAITQTTSQNANTVMPVTGGVTTLGQFQSIIIEYVQAPKATKRPKTKNIKAPSPANTSSILTSTAVRNV